jgi:diaminopimelate decarboxylase
VRTGLTDVLPATAAVQDGELNVGGVRTSALADEFGTPLVVYCKQTMLDQARAYRRAAPDAGVL